MVQVSHSITMFYNWADVDREYYYCYYSGIVYFPIYRDDFYSNDFVNYY